LVRVERLDNRRHRIDRYRRAGVPIALRAARAGCGEEQYSCADRQGFLGTFGHHAFAPNFTQGYPGAAAARITESQWVSG
jgi:hypothetical protein